MSLASLFLVASPPSEAVADSPGVVGAAGSVGCVALSQDGSLQCPSCKTIYGEKTGTQPRGKMEVFRFQVSLPGHEDCGTILIVYNIPHGIQVRATPEGVSHSGTVFPVLPQE